MCVPTDKKQESKRSKKNMQMKKKKTMMGTEPK